MKKCIWIVWVCLLGMVSFSGDIQADPPYGITLVDIKFNHDTSDDETDGVPLSGIIAPEWVTGSENQAIAYVEGSNKIILASFTCTSDTVTSAKIFATKTSGTYFTDIGEQTITFSDGDSSPQYQQFTVTDVPTSVKKTTVTWQWKFKPVGSEQNITISGPHTIYVLIASPQAPMSEPWTEVLDYSCDWASGESNADDVCEAILSNGFIAQHYDWDYDCYQLASDFAYYVGSLGIASVQHRWQISQNEPIFQENDMMSQRTNDIDPVGEYPYGKYYFRYHWWAQAAGKQRDPTVSDSPTETWEEYEDDLYWRYERCTNPPFGGTWDDNQPDQDQDCEHEDHRWYSNPFPVSFRGPE